MGKYPRQEILDAFDAYNAAREHALETGDWSRWVDCFREDAHYIEHAYGEFHGREAIREWITKAIKPFPTMIFPIDWWAFDEENGAIVLQVQNCLPHPTDPTGEVFQFPNWTRLVYGGDGLWASEEDVYNPERDAPRVVGAWLEAGGKFASEEFITEAEFTEDTKKAGG
ncbi:MAG: nuclear transport factor 2 family protein [Myxococcota bacterium]|jgi:hypothetical protein|nr:nuclear transport factor 2 family protein [bacterium]MDP7073127.1 nuclear transport factor 2 family protein [Myxococcota bacterium]MDP7300296.1 nuclear transport factor 2 family protein [Myxococcota bacterium]MDP7434279.1 nuclear transport factor 2 family protein [Myxococcota bacterium]HJO24325.1 nuclear transport factor 2 family protein [Myxococcota bacterium]